MYWYLNMNNPLPLALEGRPAKPEYALYFRISSVIAAVLVVLAAIAFLPHSSFNSFLVATAICIGCSYLPVLLYYGPSGILEQYRWARKRRKAAVEIRRSTIDLIDVENVKLGEIHLYLQQGTGVSVIAIPLATTRIKYQTVDGLDHPILQTPDFFYDYEGRACWGRQVVLFTAEREG